MNDQSQRDHFARQLALLLKMPPFTFNDWTDAFEYLSLYLKPGDIVLFDEISWMGHEDSSFISKLKAWWDKQKLSIMLFFCGSVSIWIEENILKSTAFFGRLNLTLTLEPLTISESYSLLKAYGFKGSSYENYILLSILGGIPWYLEQIIPEYSAEKIIKKLCFNKNGILFQEFDRIFHDLFNGKGTTYKKILDTLKDGIKTLSDIRKKINFSNSGTLSKIIENLITAGFITKKRLWSFKTTKPLKQSLYRICEPFIRFYLKLIESYKDKIEFDGFENVTISQLTGFDAHLGLQMEYLLLQNHFLLKKSIGISNNNIASDGPYRQSTNKTRKGCQIDFLIQTYTQNLFICEFKFKRREIGTEIIQDMEEKINSLSIPKGFAPLPVLFHIGGVTDSLATKGYFYRILDINDFLR